MNAVTEVMDELRKALALVDQLGDARDKAEAKLSELQRSTSEALAQAVEWQRERDEARAEVERLRRMLPVHPSSLTDACTDAYRRGAEAMREACAQWVDHWVSGHVADKLRDLPIPEEK